MGLKAQINIYLLITMIIFATSCSKQNETEFTIKRGQFIQTITETGELAAVNATSFIMPRYGRYWYKMKIIGLLEHGSKVNSGDSVLQLDPSPIQKFIIEKEGDLEIQKGNLEKSIVQSNNRKSELKASLRTEQASFDLKKLELEQYRFESDVAKKIKELEFKQAEIRLNKVKRNIELNEIISENELDIQKIKVYRINEEVNNSYNVLTKLTVRTPIPGIFQVATRNRKGDFVKIGDELYVGNLLGTVPDLTWMKVRTVVNEADFMKVFIGQEVNVRLDALSDIPFKGQISYISKLCHPVDNKSRQKIFDVEVTIKVSDERLKPGMTVSCEYLCAQLNDVLSVPAQCVESIDGKHFIYLKKGANFEKMEVKAGPSNNAYVVIEGDFKKGQKLVPVSRVNEMQNK